MRVRNDRRNWATEIDVFELCGKSATHNRRCYMTLHVTQTPQEKRHLQVGTYWEAPWRFGEDLHVFGFEWRKDEMEEQDLFKGFEPTGEEKAVLDRELEGFRRNPQSGSTWDEVEARLRKPTLQCGYFIPFAVGNVIVEIP